MNIILKKATRYSLLAKRFSGFTLIELLIVFGIIGVISVIGFYSFSSYSRQQILDQAASEMKGAIDQAKFNALSKVKPSVCAADAISGYIFSVCSQGTCSEPYSMKAICGDTPSDYPKIITGRFPGSTYVVKENSGDLENSTTCKTLTYNIINGFEGAGCHIVLKGYSNTRKILINSEGSASIQ